MKYKVYLKGVYGEKGFQALLKTDAKGRRIPMLFKSKIKARKHLGLEMSRGWIGKIKRIK